MVSLRSVTFLSYVAAAFILSYLPIVNWPFTWCSSFFHELSKVFLLLFSDGSILSIQLSFRGSGSSAIQGGNQWMIATSAYCGSVIWGILIYMTADKLDKRFAVIEMIALNVLIVIVTLVWVRDLITFVIFALMAAIVYFVIKLRSQTLMKMLVKFIGIYIVLNAIRAPLNLLDGRVPFDLIPLVQESGFYTFVFAFGWFLFGILGLLILWHWHKPNISKSQVKEKLFKLLD